jgi:hypothetical protein
MLNSDATATAQKAFENPRVTRVKVVRSALSSTQFFVAG